jgi:small-conductance mechanosensitive channel
MEEILNYKLLTIGDFQLRIGSLIVLFSFWIVVFFALRIIKKSINRITRFDESKRFSIYSLIKYFIYVIVAVTSLQIIGFNLSVLMAGSAALLVGLGLGIQNLFSDYISGIIILFDSSVKVNDVIEVNGLVCQVLEINLRTTTVKTRDDKYIILPNTDLTRNQLINWTHNELASRFEVSIGVDYSSDINLVMKTLQEAAIEQKGILNKPKPFVRFADYGDSELKFTIHFWAEDVFRVENTKSELRVLIFEKFKMQKIAIPFPQRVIHIKQN